MKHQEEEEEEADIISVDASCNSVEIPKEIK
jgi:hypothetical protein